MNKLIQIPTSRDPINTLCTSQDEEFTILCYQKAKPLFPYIDKFYELSHNHCSTLFDHQWNSKLMDVSCKDAEISFEDVITLIWEPVLDNLKNFFIQLKTMEIKLSTVDTFLKGLYKTPRKVYMDLDNLETALTICSGEPPDISWVEKVSDRISKYWELRTYHEPAKAFLKFRDALKLTGDFALVEKLAEGVSTCYHLCTSKLIVTLCLFCYR